MSVVRISVSRPDEILLAENAEFKSTLRAKIVSFTVQLDQAVNALASQFDAIEAAVEQIDDVEMRRRWVISVQRGREALGGVALELDRQAGNLIC